MKGATWMKEKSRSDHSPTAFSLGVLILMPLIVVYWFRWKQIVAFHDTFKIFKRRKIDFERTQRITPQVVTLLEGLNILCKSCGFFLSGQKWNPPVCSLGERSSHPLYPCGDWPLPSFLSPLVPWCELRPHSYCNSPFCFAIKVEFPFCLLLILLCKTLQSRLKEEIESNDDI